MADSIATDDGPDPRPCDAPHCRQSEERAAWEANRTTTDAYQASLREEAEKARAEADLLTETEAIVDKLSDEVLDLCEFIRDTVTGPIPDRVREIMFERLA